MRIKRVAKTSAALVAQSLGIPVDSVASERLALATWLHELRRDLPPVRGHVALLAMRNTTWIEWAVYAACWMRKLGYAPVLLYVGGDVERLYGTRAGGSLQRRLRLGDYWRQAARIPDVVLVDLDASPAPDPAAVATYADFAADYAHTMAAYDLRVEEHERGGPLRDRYEAEVERDRPILAEFGARAEGVMRAVQAAHGVRRLVAYSGLIGVTSAAGEAARRLGWDAVFCEGWAVQPGHMILSLNAPSLVYNIQRWLEALGDWDERRARDIERFLAFQETSEIAGTGGGASADGGDDGYLKNYHKFQRASAAGALDPGIQAFLDADGPLFMLAPNCVGDSATLRVRTIFESQREWIGAVCDYFRQRPHLRLVVRAHPDELFYYERNKIVIMMGDVAEAAAAGAPNIRVIKGSEDVSTYALIPHAWAGLVWMSTVGVDMAVRNCPVLAAATPKYHGLGIVHEPRTRDEYFAAVDRLAAARTGTADHQKELGKKYLTILAREFSYDAFSPDYRGRDVRLGGHPPGGEFDTFYRILSGELPPETRPPLRGKRGGEA